MGNVVIGGESAPTPVDGAGFVRDEELVKLELISADKMDEGVLLKWRVLNHNCNRNRKGDIIELYETTSRDKG